MVVEDKEFLSPLLNSYDEKIGVCVIFRTITAVRGRINSDILLCPNFKFQPAQINVFAN